MSKGFPITFRCTACRSTLLHRHEGGRVYDVVLTGRTRKHYHGGRYRNVMSTALKREYRCRCGHVGWSAHKDLQDLANRSTKRENQA